MTTYDSGKIFDQVNSKNSLSRKESIYKQFKIYKRKLIKFDSFVDFKYKLNHNFEKFKKKTNSKIVDVWKMINSKNKYIDKILSSSKTFKEKKSCETKSLLHNLDFVNKKLLQYIDKTEFEKEILESAVNENANSIKITEIYHNKLKEINELLKEMEQVNQEVTIEEDQEIVNKDEQIKNLKMLHVNKIDELLIKKIKAESDLGHCNEVYEILKKDLDAVLHKRNSLKSIANEVKRNYNDECQKLKNLINYHQKEMDYLNKKLNKRREQDSAIIKAFKLRKIEITRNLEEKTNQIKKVTMSLNESEFDKNESEYNTVDEYNDVYMKMKCLKQSKEDYEICVRDFINKIKMNEGAKQISSENQLYDIEGIAFINKNHDFIQKQEEKLKIGNGFFSTIYLAKSCLYNTKNKKLIIKLINFGNNSLIEKKVNNNSFKLMRHLIKNPHKNIVEIVDLFYISNTNIKSYYLIEECCFRSLNQLLHENNNKIDGLDIKKIAENIANALFYLHNNGIAHQNVNLNSIFVDCNKVIKLGNLETCVICYSTKKNSFVPQKIRNIYFLNEDFIAPEIKNGDLYCPIKADIYSYGLVFAYCFKQILVFTNEKCDNLDKSACSLIENCLNENANSRFSIYQVLTHCYFN